MNKYFLQNKVFSNSLLLLLCFTVAACGGKKKSTRLPGERISVLSFEQQLEADPDLAQVSVAIPDAYQNVNWMQGGGNTQNLMHHLFLPTEIKEVWKTSIGRGSNSYERLISAPVVAGDTLYAIDIKANVIAINTINGSIKWRAPLEFEERSKVGYGGGVVYSDNFLYITTGYGFILKLNANNGNEVWRYNIGSPIRGTASVSGGRVFAISFDNHMVALSATDGELIWDYVGIVEETAVLGASSPAISGETVISTFSSGEVFAMRAENGQVSWQDALSRTARLSSVSSLNDIDGNPVIDRGRVYALNHSGRMVAIDLRSGERVWDANIGGIHTPWIAGDYIFVLSSDGKMTCLSLRDGRIKWVTPLQRFKDPEDRKGLIRWTGPVLAGDRLIVVSSHGYALSLSPFNGEILGGEKLPSGSGIQPIVAGGTLYILADNGDLIAYR